MFFKNFYHFLKTFLNVLMMFPSMSLSSLGFAACSTIGMGRNTGICSKGVSLGCLIWVFVYLVLIIYLSIALRRARCEQLSSDSQCQKGKRWKFVVKSREIQKTWDPWRKTLVIWFSKYTSKSNMRLYLLNFRFFQQLQNISSSSRGAAQLKRANELLLKQL